MKKCKKCSQNKPLNEFYNSKKGKFGVRGSCKVCEKPYSKEYNKTRPKIIDEDKIQKRRETCKRYYINNRDKVLAKNRTEQHRVSSRKSYRKNKQRIFKYQKERYQNDISLRIRLRLSSRISNAVKRNKSFKCQSTLEILGCSLTELKLYLESKFQEGMSWDNYGMYGWHIDHKKPCSKFDLSKESEQKECFHYTNLQPLWAKDNLSKSDKY